MTSLIQVEDLYNQVATITGFPVYTNSTDTPDITRFLLEMISQGLHNMIESLYTNNNALQRTDKFTTVSGLQEYPVQGIVRHLELLDPTRGTIRIPYNDRVNPLSSEVPELKKTGRPESYVIFNNNIKLLPTPDKEYNMRVVLSSDDLVLANNDVYKKSVTSIDDVIIGDVDFERILALRTAALIFVRCNNALSQTYAQLARAATSKYIEKDYGSNEAQRGFERNAGHYNSRRGLLG